VSDSASLSKDKPQIKPAVSASAQSSAAPESARPDVDVVGDDAEATVEAVTEMSLNSEARARAIVKTYTGWASAAGLLPVPVLDASAVIATQIAMLKSLAALYNVPFSRKIVRPLLVSLVNGGGAVVLAAPAASLIKFVPVVGSALGMLALPALSSASCYATGRVFIAHFESGGTFLNFDPAAAREFYARHFASAKAGAEA